MSNSPEQLQPHQERSVESHEAVDKQLEKLSKNHEKTAELSPKDVETRAERARAEALRNAVSVESGGKEKDKQHTHNPTRRGPIAKKTREKSYKQTISRVQNELPAGSRVFSKIVHNKVVENVSEALAGTVARPNAILAGAFVAFALTTIMYVTAKTLGYKLSGSETIMAFVIGWIIGLIYDYFRLLATGKKT